MTVPEEFGLRAWRFPGTPVPAEARGRWCVVSVEGLAAAVPAVALLRVEFFDESGALAGERLHLRRATGRGVCFVPPWTRSARLEVVGTKQRPGDAALSFRPTGTAGAAARLLAAHQGEAARLAGELAPNLLRPRAAKEKLREALARAIAAEKPDEHYRLWYSLFGAWSPDDLPAAPGGVSLGFLVFGGADEAGQATLAALRGQHGPAPPHAVVGGAGRVGLRAALASLPGCDYVGVLQAGEVPPPHASLLARWQLAALGSPAIAYADEDQCPTDGDPPTGPLFKPEPSRALMVSGTLSRGLWLVRRGLVERLADADDGASPDTSDRWAEALRLELWLRLYEAGETEAGGARRLPFVLTHRRPDAAAAPPEALARIVGAHLRRARLPFEAEATWPLRVRPRPLPRPGRVTVVVPSALRSTEAERCIRAVLARTGHADFELVVAVSQSGPLDPAQRAAAARIEEDRRARVLPLRAGRFNFSSVNNQVVGATAGEHVLLLNDDVTPTEPDWLDAMAAHLADPAVGAVGAKLLYPGGAVQHGGVIMGLSGLCDHANRHIAGDAPGYAGRAVLAQELSAVTGACLLVRRRAFQQVSGLDERYPSAFNDVDLCLRLREAGLSVVFEPGAVLHHHELRTYGSHYGGERARFRDAEAARMRARWAGVIADDPFHNPNLNLSAGHEWEPAFPPRFRPAEAGHAREAAPRPAFRRSGT